MSPEDKDLICRMAADIAGPLLAQAAAHPRGGGLDVELLMNSEACASMHRTVAKHALAASWQIINEIESKLEEKLSPPE